MADLPGLSGLGGLAGLRQLERRRTPRFDLLAEATPDWEEALRQRVRAMPAENVGDQPHGTLQWIFELLDLPRNAIANLINVATGSRARTSSKTRGLLGLPKISAGDLLEAAGLPRATSTAGKVAQGLADFVGNVALDPLSWLTFGTSGLVGSAARKVGKVALTPKGHKALEAALEGIRGRAVQRLGAEGAEALERGVGQRVLAKAERELPSRFAGLTEEELRPLAAKYAAERGREAIQERVAAKIARTVPGAADDTAVGLGTQQIRQFHPLDLPAMLLGGTAALVAPKTTAKVLEPAYRAVRAVTRPVLAPWTYLPEAGAPLLRKASVRAMAEKLGVPKLAEAVGDIYLGPKLGTLGQAAQEVQRGLHKRFRSSPVPPREGDAADLARYEAERWEKFAKGETEKRMRQTAWQETRQFDEAVGRLRERTGLNDEAARSVLGYLAEAARSEDPAEQIRATVHRLVAEHGGTAEQAEKIFTTEAQRHRSGLAGEGPEIAEQGKAWVVPWADGRGQASFRTKSAAEKFAALRKVENDLDGPPYYADKPPHAQYGDKRVGEGVDLAPASMPVEEDVLRLDALRKTLWKLERKQGPQRSDRKIAALTARIAAAEAFVLREGPEARNVAARRLMEARRKDEEGRRAFWHEEARRAISEWLPFATRGEARAALLKMPEMIRSRDDADVWLAPALFDVQREYAHTLLRGAGAKQERASRDKTGAITSVYYRLPTGARLRISDHALPMHSEREYNWAHGWKSFDDELVISRATAPQDIADWIASQKSVAIGGLHPKTEESGKTVEVEWPVGQDPLPESRSGKPIATSVTDEPHLSRPASVSQEELGKNIKLDLAPASERFWGDAPPVRQMDLFGNVVEQKTQQGMLFRPEGNEAIRRGGQPGTKAQAFEPTELTDTLRAMTTQVLRAMPGAKIPDVKTVRNALIERYGSGAVQKAMRRRLHGVDWEPEIAEAVNQVERGRLLFEGPFTTEAQRHRETTHAGEVGTQAPGDRRAVGAVGGAARPLFVVDEDGKIARVLAWEGEQPIVVYPGNSGGRHPGTAPQGVAGTPYQYRLKDGTWRAATKTDFGRAVRPGGSATQLDLRRWREAAEGGSKGNAPTIDLAPARKLGDEVTMVTSERDHYQGRLAVVSADDILPSHQPVRYGGKIVKMTENADVPEWLQARDRSSPAALGQVNSMAKEPHMAEYTMVGADVVNGPLVLYPMPPDVARRTGKKYWLLQGNGRFAASLAWTKRQRAAYRAAIETEMGALPEAEAALERPIFGRIFEGSEEDARRIAAFGQQSGALAQSRMERARALLNGLGIKNLAGVPAPKIREPVVRDNVLALLNDPQNRRFREWLLGSVTDTKRSELLDNPAELAELVNTAFIAMLPPRVQQLAGANAQEVENMFATAAPLAARLHSLVREGVVRPEYDLYPALENAAELFVRGQKTKGSYAAFVKELDKLAMTGTLEGMADAVPGVTVPGLGLASVFRQAAGTKDPPAMVLEKLGQIVEAALADDPRQMGMFALDPVESAAKVFLTAGLGPQRAESVWRGMETIRKRAALAGVGDAQAGGVPPVSALREAGVSGVSAQPAAEGSAAAVEEAFTTETQRHRGEGAGAQTVGPPAPPVHPARARVLSELDETGKTLGWSDEQRAVNRIIADHFHDDAFADLTVKAGTPHEQAKFYERTGRTPAAALKFGMSPAKQAALRAKGVLYMFRDAGRYEDIGNWLEELWHHVYRNVMSDAERGTIAAWRAERTPEQWTVWLAQRGVRSEHAAYYAGSDVELSGRVMTDYVMGRELELNPQVRTIFERVLAKIAELWRQLIGRGEIGTDARIEAIIGRYYQPPKALPRMELEATEAGRSGELFKMTPRPVRPAPSGADVGGPPAGPVGEAAEAAEATEYVPEKLSLGSLRRGGTPRVEGEGYITDPNVAALLKGQPVPAAGAASGAPAPPPPSAREVALGTAGKEALEGSEWITDPSVRALLEGRKLTEPAPYTEAWYKSRREPPPEIPNILPRPARPEVGLAPDVEELVGHLEARAAQRLVEEKAAGVPARKLATERQMTYLRRMLESPKTRFGEWLRRRGMSIKGPAQQMRTAFREKYVHELNETIAKINRAQQGLIAADPELAQDIANLGLRPRELLNFYREDPLLAHVARELESVRMIGSAEFLTDIVRRFGVVVTSGEALPAGYTTVRAGQFGNLTAGRAFPVDVAHVLERHIGQWEQPDGLLRAYDRVLGLWKGWTLVAPAYHLRNVWGNVWNSNLGEGFSLRGLTDARAVQRSVVTNRGLDEVIEGTGFTRGQLYEKLLVDHDLIGRGFYGVEGTIGTPAAEAIIDAIRNPQSARKAVGELLARHPLRANHMLGGILEDASKIGHVITRLRRGDTLEQAAGSVKKYLFDYRDLAGFEHNVMRRIAPFYTWARKNAELLLEVALTSPAKLALVPKIQMATERQTAGEDVLPPSLRPKHVLAEGGVQLTGGTRPHFGNLAYMLPVAELRTLAEPGRVLAEQIGGPVKLAAELAANRDVYFDRPIKDYEGQRKELLGVPLPPGLKHVLRAIRPLNVAQQAATSIEAASSPGGAAAAALGAVTGVRTFPVDVGRQIFQQEREANTELGAIRRDMKRRIVELQRAGRPLEGDPEMLRLLELHEAAKARRDALPRKEAREVYRQLSPNRQKKLEEYLAGAAQGE